MAVKVEKKFCEASALDGPVTRLGVDGQLFVARCQREREHAVRLLQRVIEARVHQDAHVGRQMVDVILMALFESFGAEVRRPRFAHGIADAGRVHTLSVDVFCSRDSRANGGTRQDFSSCRPGCARSRLRICGKVAARDGRKFPAVHARFLRRGYRAVVLVRW